jgi:hypothetical protein
MENGGSSRRPPRISSRSRVYIKPARALLRAGSITGYPGRNAAAVLLKDLGTTIEAVGSKKS